MVCSYGDYNDVQLFRELGLEEIIAIGLDGRMLTSAGDFLSGLKVKQARNRMLEVLKESGNLDKVEEIAHRTPTCERSKTPIEIIPLKEYYMKVVEVKERLREIASEELRFHPEMHRQILLNWIDVALDWPISRRRYCTNRGTGLVLQAMLHPSASPTRAILSALEGPAAWRPQMLEVWINRICRR